MRWLVYVNVVFAGFSLRGALIDYGPGWLWLNFACLGACLLNVMAAINARWAA